VKNLIIINGAPGMGKTTTSEKLREILPNNVMLDCDCFMWSTPYVATEEAELIRYENIAFCTNNYLRCSSWLNVIVNWVFVSQKELDKILSLVDLTDVSVHTFSLICRNDIWKNRMESDTVNLNRNIETTYLKWSKRITDGYYNRIRSNIIDTSDMTAKEVALKIASELHQSYKVMLK
jgi:thymidylate kinase